LSNASSVNFCRKSTVSCRSMLPLLYLSRIVGRPDNRNNVPAGTPEEYYRRAIFLYFLDGILTQMSLRFCNHEAAVLRLCGLLPKFAPNVSFRDIEEGVDYYDALLPCSIEAVRRARISAVMLSRPGRPRPRSKPRPTVPRPRPRPRPTCPRPRPPKSGLETNITEFHTCQILCHAMDNQPCDCMSALRMCDKHSIRQFILCCMSIFATVATSVHSNSGTYVFCAKVSAGIFEIIYRRRAPHWVGFGKHSS
jgi:hypothetical protein